MPRQWIALAICFMWGAVAVAQDDLGLIQTVDLVPGDYIVDIPAGWRFEYTEGPLGEATVLSGNGLDIVVALNFAQQISLTADATPQDFLFTTYTDLFEISIARDSIRALPLGVQPGAALLYQDNNISIGMQLSDGNFVYADVFAQADAFTAQQLDDAQAVVQSIRLPGEQPQPLVREDVNCIITASAGDSVTLRVGPGEDRGAIAFLGEGDYQALSQTTDSGGEIWFQLDPRAATPTKEAIEVWVAEREVNISEDCEFLTNTPAPPLNPADVVQPVAPEGEGES